MRNFIEGPLRRAISLFSILFKETIYIYNEIVYIYGGYLKYFLIVAMLFIGFFIFSYNILSNVADSEVDYPSSSVNVTDSISEVDYSSSSVNVKDSILGRKKENIEFYDKPTVREIMIFCFDQENLFENESESVSAMMTCRKFGISHKELEDIYIKVMESMGKGSLYPCSG